MKKTKFSKKLNLQKEQIANLNNIRGGDDKTKECVETDPCITPAETNTCGTSFAETCWQATCYYCK